MKTSRIFVASLALGLSASVLGAGCAKPIQLPTQIPDVVVTTDQDVKAAAIKGLGLIEALGWVTVKAQAVEVRFMSETHLSPAAHQSIQRGFLAIAAEAKQVTAKINDGTLKTWAQLRDAIAPLTASVQGVLDAIQSAGSGLKAALGVLWDFLKDIGITALNGLGESMFGGRRDLQPLEVIQ